MTFRSLLFWLHLLAGLLSGAAIAVMCFTGTVLAFEKELIAWAERDARVVPAPAPGSPRLALAELQARLRAAEPEARPAAIVVQNDPHAAVAFTVGRTGGYYVNPYTGDVRRPGSAAMADFMRLMTAWHRTLGLNGEDSRPVGKLINGSCNLAFCVLALTGLYLWLPRTWSWRAVRPVIWFRQNSSGKARDFNWHNAIGFWSAPVLIVLTLTAVPISFRWGGNLILALTGTPSPAVGGGGPAGGPGAGPALPVPPPPAGAKPLSPDALVAAVQQAMPAWKTITLRLAAGGPGGAGAPGGRGGRGGDHRAGAGDAGPPGGGEARAKPEAAAASATAATLTVRESSSWPRTATTTVSVDPYRGDILRRSGHAELPAAQRVRAWTRFLHTGEALGGGGQLLAGLACLGGLFLVYTGIALSWRRFCGKTPVPG